MSFRLKTILGIALIEHWQVAEPLHNVAKPQGPAPTTLDFEPSLE